MKHYSQNGIITNSPEYEKLDGTISNKSKKMSFKEAFLKYVELKNQPFTLSSEAENLIKVQPLIKDAYNLLGADRVKSLKYIKKDIQAAIVNLDADKSKENKAAMILKDRVTVGFNATPSIQTAIAEAYSTVGLDRTVKASEIEKYFDCKATVKRIDGKPTRGYEIYRSKIVFG